MSTLTEQAVARCRSWVIHSGLSSAEIGRRANISEGTVRRFKRGEVATYRVLEAIERTVPKNWRDPMPGKKDVA